MKYRDMERREVLYGIGASLFLAGCSGQAGEESTPEPTETSTPTPTPTPSPTPEPRSPQVLDTGLLSHYDEYGDVLENQVSAVGAGSTATIGLRYTLPIHDGQSKEFVQVTIYDEESSIDSQSAEDTNLSDEGSEVDSWERWFDFDTTDWELGTYTAEAIVRDEVTGKNSSVQEAEFEVVSPFEPDEIELTDVSQPPKIETGGRVTFSWTFRNRSERDSSIVSSISARYEGSQWYSVSDTLFQLNIPAGETRTFEGDPTTFDRAGTYEYRFDDIGAIWEVTVSE
jgi:hypothetical protein